VCAPICVSYCGTFLFFRFFLFLSLFFSTCVKILLSLGKREKKLLNPVLCSMRFPESLFSSFVFLDFFVCEPKKYFLKHTQSRNNRSLLSSFRVIYKRTQYTHKTKWPFRCNPPLYLASKLLPRRFLPNGTSSIARCRALLNYERSNLIFFTLLFLAQYSFNRVDFDGVLCV
jgi:hypothetical protein